jgi:TRAP-type mannitol/chloroaromatic compound transport system permease small subunit
LRAVAAILERIAVAAGSAVARVALPIVVAGVAFTAVARWIGWAGEAPAELSTLAFLALTMASFGDGYASGSHVRLDILSRRFSPEAKAVIELAGVLLVLAPLCFVVVVDGAYSTALSFAQGERWGDTAWPLQWLVRLWVPVGFALLAVAALASALRSLAVLLRK